MKYNVYSVRDVHNGFGAPILDQSHESAKRGFAYAVNNTNPIMGYAPKDFDLFFIGTLDSDTGYLSSLPVPELVCSGTSCVGG